MRRVLLTVAVLACLTVGLGTAVPADRTLSGRGKHPAGRLGAASTGPVLGAAAAPRPLSAPHIGTAVCVESVNGSPVRPCRPVCATTGPRTICLGRLVAWRHVGSEKWAARYRREHTRRLAAERKLQAGSKQPQAFGSLYAIRLASALYQVPLNEMLNVARCETGGTYDANARNPSSSASGLFQWLDSSWAAQGVPGFSVFDPIPNALAAARAVVRDGGWRQWVCKPR